MEEGFGLLHSDRLARLYSVASSVRSPTLPAPVPTLCLHSNPSRSSSPPLPQPRSTSPRHSACGTFEREEGGRARDEEGGSRAERMRCVVDLPTSLDRRLRFLPLCISRLIPAPPTSAPHHASFSPPSRRAGSSRRSRGAFPFSSSSPSKADFCPPSQPINALEARANLCRRSSDQDNGIYSLPCTTYAAAMTCPQGYGKGQYGTVLLVHGTGSTGLETWGDGPYLQLLPAEGFDVCYGLSISFCFASKIS